ncbi:hypothetical protein CBM2633_A50014 [Cupriavidus taiwanensis]|nr:hypothetical protein CBM2604_A50274 [Cupriavidus taiwanensis]SOZ27677.1 hypothetical protein CBM2609_A60274 [Cupriavidus taiwanensis]SOZ46004.1 hypothetical protein CBM2610_A70272 [Cupriavidus taiwanensis]SPA14128.1 hypothetical protein CBM2633_A50014 [Cupriavidus taiwanensis]
MFVPSPARGRGEQSRAKQSFGFT